MIRTGRWKRTLALAMLVLGLACKGEAQRAAVPVDAPAAPAAPVLRPGEIHVIEGDFPPEPSDAVAQATKDMRGWISVRTKDEWARVEIDGERVGDTPLNRAPVASGRHTVALQFSRGSRISGDFDVSAGGHVRLTATPAPDAPRTPQ